MPDPCDKAYNLERTIVPVVDLHHASISAFGEISAGRRKPPAVRKTLGAGIARL